MGFIISTVDTAIKIPPNFKHLTGKDPYEVLLKAETPTEVPDKILDYFTKHRPHVFRRGGEQSLKSKTPGTKEELDKILAEEFNAEEFLIENHENMAEAIDRLGEKARQKMFKIASLLKLSNYQQQSNDRLKERIVNDIKAKKDHAEKLTKGETK